jgi:hypothetical protein
MKELPPRQTTKEDLPEPDLYEVELQVTRLGSKRGGKTHFVNHIPAERVFPSVDKITNSKRFDSSYWKMGAITQPGYYLLMNWKGEKEMAQVRFHNDYRQQVLKYLTIRGSWKPVSEYVGKWHKVEEE